MLPAQDAERDRRADQSPAEDPCRGELAQPHVRQQHGDHHEAELDDEEPERHADHETRLARGAMDQGHDDDAVDDVEQVMQDGEEGEAAQHGEGAERLSHGGVDDGEPDPDARRDDDAEPGALAQRVVFARHRRPPGYGEPPSFCRSSVSTRATRVAASNGFVTKRSAPRATACPPTSIAPALLTPDIATIFTAGHSRRSRPIVDRKSTRLNSSHSQISYAVFCLKKKKKTTKDKTQCNRTT